MFARLADLHAVDTAAAGLDAFSRGPGYVGRQVEGWSRRFRDARTDDVPDGEDVMAWLHAHQPVDSGSVLIHGDWRLDNLVLDPADLSSMRAALDWEMATVGDPLMDLGAALAYWVQADDDDVFAMFRRQPSHLPGMPTRDEIVAAYADRSGLDVGGWAFYEVYGLFRLGRHRPADLVALPPRADHQPRFRGLRRGRGVPARPGGAARWLGPLDHDQRDVVGRAGPGVRADRALQPVEQRGAGRAARRPPRR